MSRPKKEGGTGSGLPHISVRLDPFLMGLLEKYSAEMKSNKAEFARNLIKEELLRLYAIEALLKSEYSADFDVTDKMSLYQRAIDKKRKELSYAEANDNDLTRKLLTTTKPIPDTAAMKQHSVCVIERLNREIDLYKSRIKAAADEMEFFIGLADMPDTPAEAPNDAPSTTEYMPDDEYIDEDPDAPF